MDVDVPIVGAHVRVVDAAARRWVAGTVAVVEEDGRSDVMLDGTHRELCGVLPQHLHFPAAYWEQMSWERKLAALAEYKERGNQDLKAGDVGDALRWYAMGVAYGELEFGGVLAEVQRHAAGQPAALRKLKVGETVLVLQEKHARALRSLEESQRRLAAQARAAVGGGGGGGAAAAAVATAATVAADAAGDGDDDSDDNDGGDDALLAQSARVRAEQWRRPLASVLTVALLNARPGMVACVEEDARSVEVMYGGLPAVRRLVEEPDAQGDAGSAADGGEEGGNGEEEEEEEEAVPIWRVRTIRREAPATVGAVGDGGAAVAVVGSEHAQAGPAAPADAGLLGAGDVDLGWAPAEVEADALARQGGESKGESDAAAAAEEKEGGGEGEGDDDDDDEVDDSGGAEECKGESKWAAGGGDDRAREPRRKVGKWKTLHAPKRAPPAVSAPLQAPAPPPPCPSAVAMEARAVLAALRLNQARVALRVGDLPGAERALTDVVGTAPLHGTALYLRAKTRLASGWIPQARHDLSLARQLLPPASLGQVADLERQIARRAQASKKKGRAAVRALLQYVDEIGLPSVAASGGGGAAAAGEGGSFGDGFDGSSAWGGAAGAAAGSAAGAGAVAAAAAAAAATETAEDRRARRAAERLQRREEAWAAAAASFSPSPREPDTPSSTGPRAGAGAGSAGGK